MRGLASRGNLISGDARDRERGQATVEFALIIIPLLIIVAGIIQFGIALNYWLDMQRTTNQGARWATVNNWPPDCALGSSSCAANPACSGTRTGATLQNTLRCQVLSNGLRGSSTIKICYPNSTELAGDPVRVEISAPFKVVPIMKIGTIYLSANATMRLEQRPTLITGEVAYDSVKKRCA